MPDPLPSAPVIQRRIKGALRLLFFATLVFGMIPFQLLLRTTSKIGIGPDPVFLGRLNYKIVIWLLGFNVRVFGAINETRPTLYVSNHTSYLDIPVLGSLIPALFVAKSEVAGWPIFGFLTKIYNTVFVERRAVRAATQSAIMRDKLEQGQSLILFPEGTSTDGLKTLPFKSSLFSILDHDLKSGKTLAVQPVTVVFTAISGLPVGRTWRHYYAWYGDMTLMGHLFRAFCLGHFSIDVIFHPAITGAALKDRKILAEHCQNAVARGVESCLRGKPVISTKAIQKSKEK